MINIVTALGSIFGSLILTYPETRIVNFILMKINQRSKGYPLLTSLIVMLINAILVIVFNYSGNQAALILTSSVPALILWAYIDSKRSSDSPIIRFIHNKNVRVSLFSLLFFVLLFVFLDIIRGIGINDDYYLISGLLSFVYCYFALRTKNHHKTTNPTKVIQGNEQ
jgi:hypothetical protein